MTRHLHIALFPVLALAAGCKDDACRTPSDCVVGEEICADGRCVPTPTGQVPGPAQDGGDARPRYFLDARPDTGTATVADAATSSTADGGPSDGPTDAGASDGSTGDGSETDGPVDGSSDAGRVDAAASPHGYATIAVISGSSDNFAEATFRHETPTRTINSRYTEGGVSCELVRLESAPLVTRGYDATSVEVTGLASSIIPYVTLVRFGPGEYAVGPIFFPDLFDPTERIYLEVEGVSGGLSSGQIGLYPPPAFDPIAPVTGQIISAQVATRFRWTPVSGSRNVFIDFFDDAEMVVLRCTTIDDKGTVGVFVPSAALADWMTQVAPVAFTKWAEIGYEERTSGTFGSASGLIPTDVVARQGARYSVQ
ncbi:MAG: hypothetical protein HYV07_05690 [Deltaproteobacteria bacterium]|nr:hypothetical protein [Deltaproteobacteria bacterium]